MENNSKKADPGWNDPPMLNYSTSNPPPKTRISNKRIAFPLNTTTNCASPSSSLDHNETVTSTKADVEEKVPQMGKITFSNFDELLQSSPPSEVCNKIEVMKNMWTNGEFSTNIKNDIYELSTSILHSDRDNANKLHLKLLMNNSDKCKKWISAMQYFIGSLGK